MHTSMPRRFLLSVLAFSGAAFAAGAQATRPVDASAGGRRVGFGTEDNIAIVGTYYPPPGSAKRPAPVAVLLHMYRHDRHTFDPLVPALTRAGFAVLAIDLRGHGESAGPDELGLADRVARRDPKLFQSMYRDVEAAYAWLAEQPEVDLSRWVLVGASVGCSVALDYAVRDRSVDGVICLTPGVNYLGIDSDAHARKYGARPLLLIASESEKADAEALGRLVEGATVKIVTDAPGGKDALHGTRMFGKVEDIERLIADFAAKAAGPPSGEQVVASRIGQVYYDPDSTAARNLSPKNLRRFSSAREAEERGYRTPRKKSTKAD